MNKIKQRENEVYKAVQLGELTIDSEGRIWRIAARRGNKWTGQTTPIACTPRRAENVTGEYLQVRVMFDRQRHHAMAHRLVYLHFVGPIPEGMTINHKNGIKIDNRPENLEPATDAEQTIHALHVLGRGRTDQTGTRNAMARLTAEQVSEIRRRRVAGERLVTIAADFGVTFQTVSRIALGNRWA